MRQAPPAPLPPEPLPHEALALLDAIAIGAGGDPLAYDDDCGDAVGRPGGGRYGLHPAVCWRLAGELGLSDFSPENQDQAAWHMASRAYRRGTGRDLIADLSQNPPVLAWQALAAVWSGIDAQTAAMFAGALTARRRAARDYPRYRSGPQGPRAPMPLAAE